MFHNTPKSREAKRIPLAERFKSPQGEGVFTGVMMGFIRTVGCSVGQTVCTHCDTQFDRTYPERGGGLYTPHEIAEWVEPLKYACITGGEPFDRNLEDLVHELGRHQISCHFESSGTKPIPDWFVWSNSWLCISPKPGFLEDVVLHADEVKIIYQGLGDGPGWPTLADAKRWAALHKIVYLQPRNFEHQVNTEALQEVIDVVAQNPELRISAQLHKFLQVR